MGPAMRAGVQVIIYEHAPRRNCWEVGKQVEGRGPSEGVIPRRPSPEEGGSMVVPTETRELALLLSKSLVTVTG